MSHHIRQSCLCCGDEDKCRDSGKVLFNIACPNWRPQGTLSVWEEERAHEGLKRARKGQNGQRAHK